MNMVINIYRSLGRNLGTAIVPAGLLVAALLLVFNLVSLPQAILPIVQVMPYGILGMAVGLGWWFHRSKVVYLGLMLIATHWFLLTYFQSAPPGPDALGQIAYASVAVLLPLNMMAVALMEERGLVTEVGLGRLAVFLLQGLAVAALTGTDVWLDAETGAAVRVTVDGWLHARIFPKDYDFWTFLPQPALHLFTLAFLLLVVLLWRGRGAAMEAGQLGALMATALALHLVGDGQGTSLFLLAAGVSLLLGMAQDTYRMAFMDELTNLPSRRALQTMMLKLGRRYAIAMLDVDHFKKFNDTHGHDVGDQVLRMVAARLDQVRGGGRAFRYGGEEFTVVFRGRDAEQAMPFLEDLRQAVEQASFSLRNQNRPEERPDRPRRKGQNSDRVSVTISIGVAQSGSGGESPEEVIKSADEALYRAKKAGRNRVSA